MSWHQDTSGDWDSPDMIDAVDPSGMLKLISGFPDQCRKAAAIGKSVTVPTGDFRNLVVLGLGGSAIGGDLLRALLEVEGATVPIVVTRDYRCPGFVNSHTICIAASFSGDTEETLSASYDALRRGAALLPITSGGALTALAKERGITPITVPGGQPPRSALGLMFLPVLSAVSRMGLTRDFSADVEEAIEVMDKLAAECAPDVPEDQNEAKQIAMRMHEALPVIYGASPLTGLVAFRWKCQFNENAKMHATSNNLPELDHNEICAWRAADEQGLFRWVFLRDRRDPVRLSQRLEVTRSIMASHSTGHTDIWGRGESLLARTMSLILLGDFVTCYAGLLNGTNPTDISEINVLKRELSLLSMQVGA